MTALLWMLKREYRDRYPSSWAFVGESLGLVMSLLIYWYTSRAFSTQVGGELARYKLDYFGYLIVGEMTLFAPLLLFEGTSKTLRQCAADGTIEALIALPVRPEKTLGMLTAAAAPREWLRILATCLLAKVAFGLHLSWSEAGGWFAFQLAAIPAFLGLGLLMAALMLRFGRGDSLLSYVSAAAAIAAGAYFPVAYLPEAVRSLAAGLSPFNALLEGTRALWISGWSGSAVFTHLGALLLWGAVLLPCGWLALRAAFERARRTGSPILFAA